MILIAFALKLSAAPQIEELVRLLHDTFSVLFIGVCEVLPRVNAPFFIGAASILNHYLRGVLEPIPYVFSWRHRGFQQRFGSLLFARRGSCELFWSILIVSQLPRRHFNGSSRAASLTLSHVHWITFVDIAALFLCLLNSPSGILPPRAVLGRAKLEALVHVINKQSCRDPTLRGVSPGSIFVSDCGLPVSRSVFSNRLLRASISGCPLSVPNLIIGLIIITGRAGQFAWAAAPLCC